MTDKEIVCALLQRAWQTDTVPDVPERLSDMVKELVEGFGRIVSVTMDQAPLPCPHCCGAAIVEKCTTQHWATCSQCGSTGPVRVSKLAALAAWNSRMP